MNRCGRLIHLRSERDDLSCRRHQGQGHRFGAETVELLHKFLRAGAIEDRLDDLVYTNVLAALRATHVILGNIIQIVAPAQIAKNSKKSFARD